ncbi:hypothetical protein QW060_10715 [Myroides ceti]|uniref:Uncharacterized protein n=1 Tax=Paenimyroides ceti TaxID=395087 RepID=A0ABT8CWS5_9FLAO|nr:hypothetical protein [Paenimyroides ceti]MDN3707605.1 hypothetical protein [Paenimyroides ceti]
MPVSPEYLVYSGSGLTLNGVIRMLVSSNFSQSGSFWFDRPFASFCFFSTASSNIVAAAEGTWPLA